ncbi:hypothetical protein WN48_10677 [Eufriesea mexicana]|uniref:Uncharacterized protein n=1 Tax=Eufriesea mexicana TaxID=516756 RepID=A0A310SI07_9HYME|nr:hypothetical protein WN48_10677 [Eufriesea mexicana]
MLENRVRYIRFRWSHVLRWRSIIVKCFSTRSKFGDALKEKTINALVAAPNKNRGQYLRNQASACKRR